MDEHPTCGTCAFAAPCVDDGEPYVQCRRFPPTVIVVDGETACGFPTVTEEDWCGEWMSEDE